jgi:hypothetical protein
MTASDFYDVQLGPREWRNRTRESAPAALGIAPSRGDRVPLERLVGRITRYPPKPKIEYLHEVTVL